MKKILGSIGYGLLILTLLVSGANAQILKSVSKLLSGGSLSEEEVVSGLKAALEKGIEVASKDASQKDGYFGNSLIKIPFPPEAVEAEKRLRAIGLGSEVDKFVLSLNRAAERAAKESVNVFVAGIKAMTVQDARGILQGKNDAATQYLKRTTSPSLKAKFKPIVSDALDEVSATKYYADLVIAYNKIPFVKKMNPDLKEYATDQAIKGLFVLVAREEAKIREDPLERTSDILKKVFGSN